MRRMLSTRSGAHALKGAPFEAFWPVSHHIFPCGVEQVGHWAVVGRGFGPELRPLIVGAPPEQEIEAVRRARPEACLGLGACG